MSATVVFTGNIGRDPESKKTTYGDMAKFSVAVKGSKKGEDGKYVTDWYSCSAFGSTANYVLQYCGKGSMVEVAGSLDFFDSEKYGKTPQVKVFSVNGLKSARPQVKENFSGPAPKQEPTLTEDDVPW